MNENNNEVQLDLGELLLYLKKRVWILIAAFSVFAMLGFLYSEFFVTPTYKANATAYVLTRDSDGSVIFQDIQISTYVLKDYEILVTSRNVTSEVVKMLDLDLSPAAVAGMITVEVPENTRTLKISVTDTDPQRVADITNAVMEVSAKQIQEIMGADAVNVIDQAEIPTGPSSPNVIRNTILGAIIGLALAVGVLTVIFMLDDSIKTEEDVEHRLGLATLGVIPISEEMGHAPVATRRKRTGKRK